MLEHHHLRQAEQITQDFFGKMTFPVTIKNALLLEQTILLEIDSDAAQVLIGQGGRTLMELQQILGRILRKQLGELARFDLDINRYKSGKIQHLIELAADAANEVALEGREKILAPMTAFERRVVHTELAKRNDIITESAGCEPERRVIIKPAPKSF